MILDPFLGNRRPLEHRMQRACDTNRDHRHILFPAQNSEGRFEFAQRAITGSGSLRKYHHTFIVLKQGCHYFDGRSDIFMDIDNHRMMPVCQYFLPPRSKVFLFDQVICIFELAGT